MLRTTFLVRIVILAIIIFTTVCFYTVVNAQQQAGVRISPALIEESLDPGIEKNYTLIIENQEQAERKFYLSTRNISDVTETGNPIFAKDPNEVTGMELASWIELSQTELTLGPNERTEISFKMRLPLDASPGSHFGGIFISIDPPDIENSGAAVSYQVANIISIFVSGDVNETANIRQFSTDKYFYGSKDIDFNLRIDNPGNVLVRPIGPLEIRNMLGQKIETLIFNDSQADVFPGTDRSYSMSWEGQGLGFGRYEALVSVVYGEYGGKKTISSTVSFWILPMSIIGPALGALAFILLVTFLIVRVYINRTLAKMSYGNTRLVRSRRRQGPSPILLLVLVMLMVTALFMIVLLALFA